MFSHPEHVLREQQRRHAELISEMGMERRAAAARLSHHQFRTIARRAREYVSSRLWRHIFTSLFTRHRTLVPGPAVPRRMAPTTPYDTPKAAGTAHTAAGCRDW